MRGITRDALLLRMTEDDFAAVLDANLMGAFRVVKRAARGMLRARQGRIVLVASAFLTFWCSRTELITTCSPSVSTQVWVTWGDPSGITVARKHRLGWRKSAIRPSGRFTLD